MLSGYFSLGEVEIINTARVYTYANNAECVIPIKEVTGVECLPGMLDQQYTDPVSDGAPWYDSFYPETADFYGVLPIRVRGLSDSTRDVPVIESIMDGGAFGVGRYTTREVEFRVMLVAGSMAALEHGTAWLRTVLSDFVCAGGDCQGTSLMFFTDCVDVDPAFPAADQVKPFWRVLRESKVVEGPVEVSTQKLDKAGWVRTVTFELVSGNSFLFGLPNTVPVDLYSPTIVTDDPVNLFVYPSAEVAGNSFDVNVAENLCPNPSVEVDDTGWSGSVSAVSGPVPDGVVSGRSTGFAVRGSASFLVQVEPTSGSGVAEAVAASPAVPVGATATGSIFVWATDPSVLADNVQRMYGRLEFLDGSNNVVGTVDGPDVDPDTGGVSAVYAAVPPVGATQFRVAGVVEFDWASGDDFRFYTDIAFLSNP